MGYIICQPPPALRVKKWWLSEIFCEESAPTFTATKLYWLSAHIAIFPHADMQCNTVPAKNVTPFMPSYFPRSRWWWLMQETLYFFSFYSFGLGKCFELIVTTNLACWQKKEPVMLKLMINMEISSSPDDGALIGFLCLGAGREKWELLMRKSCIKSCCLW